MRYHRKHQYSTFRYGCSERIRIVSCQLSYAHSNLLMELWLPEKKLPNLQQFIKAWRSRNARHELESLIGHLSHVRLFDLVELS